MTPRADAIRTVELTLFTLPSRSETLSARWVWRLYAEPQAGQLLDQHPLVRVLWEDQWEGIEGSRPLRSARTVSLRGPGPFAQ